MADVEFWVDTVLSVHLVVEMKDQELIDWGCPECEGNPAHLSCIPCKGFKAYGICSHVLACNHMREEYNVRYNLRTIGKSKAKTPGHGNYMSTAVPKALKRLPERAPDSSDEEDERFMALYKKGR